MTARRALAAALLALALLRPAGAGEEAPARKPERTPPGEAARYVGAHRAKDEATMEALAADARKWPHLDPHCVAHRLFAEDALDAARDFARRVAVDRRRRDLPGVVEGWSRLDAAGRAFEGRADALYGRVASKEPRDAAAREELLALVGRELEGAPPGMGQALLRNAESGLLARAGRLEEAVPKWREAAAAAAEVPWPSGQAGCLWMAADHARRCGDLVEARSRWAELLALHDALGERAARAQTLCDMAVRLEPFGESAEVEECAERALRDAEAEGDRWVAAQALHHLANARARGGEHARALADLDEVRRRFRVEHRSELGAAHALASQGRILAGLGLLDRAAEALESAAAEVDALGKNYASVAARFRCDLGRVLADAGRHDRAAELLERAHRDLAATGDRGETARALALLGDVLARKGEHGRAAEALERAARDLAALGLRPAAAEARADLGRLAEATGERRAQELLTQAHIDLAALGDRLGAARVERDLAAIARRRGDPAEALRLARRSVEARLAVGIGLGEEERVGVRRDARAAADEGVLAARDLLASGGVAGEAAAEAFWFAESGRGLLLAEGIANREALLAAAVPAAVREQDAAARARVVALRDRLAEVASIPETTPESLRAAKAALDGAYRGLEESAARFQREARRVAEVVYPRPATLAALQATLDEGTAFVLYHLAGDRALAVVTTRAGVRLADLGPAGRLCDDVRRYLALVPVEGSRDERRAAALYDALLRPLEPEIAGRPRIVISPDGPLTFLPFEALVRAGDGPAERVIERWTVSYAPSATVRVLLARDASAGGARGKGLLALGDPAYPGNGGAGGAAARRGTGPLRRLPGSAAEVRSVAGLFPEGERTVLLGEKASVAGLQSALERPGGRLAVLHLACHGLVDPERPRLTGLALAGGEVLGVDQVHRMRVPADLVILSACETGLGRILHGEGATGLARGFLFAGAEGVVVSDWAVSDEATRGLMASFCGRMLRDGLPPREALRAAKLEAIKAGGPASHPAHWAAFVLWGD